MCASLSAFCHRSLYWRRDAWLSFISSFHFSRASSRFFSRLRAADSSSSRSFLPSSSTSRNRSFARLYSASKFAIFSFCSPSSLRNAAFSSSATATTSGSGFVCKSYFKRFSRSCIFATSVSSFVSAFFRATRALVTSTFAVSFARSASPSASFKAFVSDSRSMLAFSSFVCMFSVVSFNASSSSVSFSSKVDFSTSTDSKRALVFASNSSRNAFSRSAKDASNSLFVVFVCKLVLSTSLFNASIVFVASNRVPFNRETSALSVSLRAAI
mmetsp:Transcript_3305/g.10138  ORF Transcript_3305/g.10138 Transcript_3305/m.10138 type:complete len:270 (+) Transcript_3305:3305-4114(+)